MTGMRWRFLTLSVLFLLTAFGLGLNWQDLAPQASADDAGAAGPDQVAKGRVKAASKKGKKGSKPGQVGLAPKQGGAVGTKAANRPDPNGANGIPLGGLPAAAANGNLNAPQGAPVDGNRPAGPGDQNGGNRPGGGNGGAGGMGPDPKHVDKVIAIQDRHTDELLKLKGVVGTATGLDDDGNVVIKVYTDGADQPDVPETIEDIPVQVVERGPIFPLWAKADRKDRLPRPVPIGVSAIADTGICASGTLGCRLRDKQGNVYALSNNHVFAEENNAPIGNVIVQPSPGDQNCNVDATLDFIGNLYAFKPIVFTATANNVIDAAVMRTTTNLVNTGTLPDGYGVPRTETVQAYLGQPVQKYGRTTGYTQGVVSGLNATIVVGYSGGVARFIKQIQVDGANGYASLGAPGDSGSLVVDEQRRPMGLLFAGGGGITDLNPIDDVLRYFSMAVDSEGATPIGKVGKAHPENPRVP
ncbi:MAG: hypothetical protein ACKV0T_30010 [Planctomycetales bacterium]